VPRPPISLATDADVVREGLVRIRQEHHLPDGFDPSVLVEAAEVARRWESDGVARSDRRDLPLVTIDPPGSRDLDQALHIERRASGYRVHYAIADVAAFVTPGGAVDAEAWVRGVTIYVPDGRVLLHPPELSEGAGSLLPSVDRPALLWEIDLDSDGTATRTSVTRAVVRSRSQLDYAGVQAQIDGGGAPEGLQLLAEVGRLRHEQEVGRGGVSLDLPSQRVVDDEDGFHLELEPRLQAMAWNAQISLLTGTEAARLMVAGGIGVLRTLPAAPKQTIQAIRRTALALGIPWPKDATYADVVRALDPSVPSEAAMLTQAAHALRGAGYAGFTDGQLPELTTHAAVAAPYAHVTAPLRRLVDRYAGEVAVALCAGVTVAEPIAAALAALPEAMAAARNRESAVDRDVLDLVEACVLVPHIGRTVAAVVTDVDERGALVVLRDPPVVTRTRITGLELGAEIDLRVVSADPVARRVELALA
jgi:exoribonuclease R